MYLPLKVKKNNRNSKSIQHDCLLFKYRPISLSPDQKDTDTDSDKHTHTHTHINTNTNMFLLCEKISVCFRLGFNSGLYAIPWDAAPSHPQKEKPSCCVVEWAESVFFLFLFILSLSLSALVCLPVCVFLSFVSARLQKSLSLLLKYRADLSQKL